MRWVTLAAALLTLLAILVADAYPSDVAESTLADAWLAALTALLLAPVAALLTLALAPEAAAYAWLT